MTIKYQLQLLSDWHCGAGLTAGAAANSTVIKDANSLPYIPGKTIKGLLKNSLLEINDVSKPSMQNVIVQIFGKSSSKDDEIKYDETEPGIAYFSNATLPKNERAEIIANDLADLLYRNLASTAIDDRGIAESGSLRVMQVCMPILLEGTIEGVDENQKVLLEKTFKWTRHLGVNRNRGLGRCRFQIIEP